MPGLRGLPRVGARSELHKRPRQKICRELRRPQGLFSLDRTHGIGAPGPRPARAEGPLHPCGSEAMPAARPQFSQTGISTPARSCSNRDSSDALNRSSGLGRDPKQIPKPRTSRRPLPNETDCGWGNSGLCSAASWVDARRTRTRVHRRRAIDSWTCMNAPGNWISLTGG